MLPFLKNKDEAGVSAPADKIERKSDNPEELDLLEGCIEELISAIKSGDAKAAARAFKDAAEVCDAMPHTEGEHFNG